MMPSRKHRFATLMAAGTLMVALALAVLADRALGSFFSIPPPGIGTGLIFRPNQAHSFATAEYSYTVHTNALGLRERDLRPRSSERFRVAVIGDSFTFGWGVEEEERWTYRVEALLNQDGFDLEVLNCGKPGVGPATYAEVASRIIPILQPDLVIVALYQGDDLASSDVSAYAPQRLGVGIAQLLVPRLFAEVSRWRTGLPRRRDTPEENRLVSQIRAQGILKAMSPEARQRFDALDQGIRNAYLEGNLNPYLIRMAVDCPDAYSYLLEPDSPRCAKSTALLTEHLKRIGSIAAQHGARTIAVSIPHGVFVNQNAYENTKRLGFLVDPAMLTTQGPDATFRKACDAAAVPLVTVTDEFRRHQGEDGLYFDLDSHFTPQGHRLFAQIAAPHLAEFLPRTDGGRSPDRTTP